MPAEGLIVGKAEPRRCSRRTQRPAHGRTRCTRPLPRSPRRSPARGKRTASGPLLKAGTAWGRLPSIPGQECRDALRAQPCLQRVRDGVRCDRYPRGTAEVGGSSPCRLGRAQAAWSTCWRICQQSRSVWAKSPVMAPSMFRSGREAPVRRGRRVG
jgi:hypothetical protein